jgi:ParB family chromosome partitioning protein
MAGRKVGLGKGLDTLIPDNVGAYEMSKPNKEKDRNKEGSILLKIIDIEPNREQPRKIFNEDSLQELADSIKQFGVIQPLVVQKKDNRYEIIAGERRWRASKLAGIKEVPVIIKDYTPQEIMEISLIENIQREDLNPIEEAIAFQKLINEFKLKQDDLAERISKSRSAISNAMRLLNLDERVQQMLIDEMISSGHARALLAIEDKEEQYKIANRVFDEKLNVRDIERIVKELTGNTKEKKIKTENSFIYKNIEDEIRSVLGTKVLISNKDNKKGKIQIEYYSQDELERIVDLIKSIN